jgi:rhodanese-related sulfurtransferase
VAAELNQQGYVNAKALLGGVAAWQHAGFPIVAAPV